MKLILIIPAFLLLWNLGFSQTFTYSSSKNFGTSGNDVFSDVVRLPNGETIFCGAVSAASDDHTGAIYGGQDYWVVKTGANDNIIWEKVFGGSGNDFPYNIEVNSSGEIFAIGTSDSPNDGNKTTTGFGLNDIWVVKLDIDGTLLDQFSYGTTVGDDLFCGATAMDANENIIVCGHTAAGISGNKTSPAYGSGDVWLFRINSQGAKVDDISLGGTSPEYGGDIIVDANDRIFVSIQSESGATGNKTTDAYGDADIWLVKLNPNFSIVSQNSFGGTQTEIVAGMMVSASNLFVSLTSNSDPSGNKTCERFGNYDGVLIKCDTSDLTIVNQASYGGSSTSACFFSLSQVSNGLVASGFSNGGPNVFKDAASFGGLDIWILSVNNDLQPLWNLTVGGNATDGSDFVKIVQSNPGELEIYSDFSSGSMTGNIGCTNYGNGDFLHYVFSTDLGLEEGSELFSLYPNPATDELIIESRSHAPENIDLLTSDGKRLGSYSITPGVNSIKLNMMSSGGYLLQSGSSVIRFTKI